MEPATQLTNDQYYSYFQECLYSCTLTNPSELLDESINKINLYKLILQVCESQTDYFRYRKLKKLNKKITSIQKDLTITVSNSFIDLLKFHLTDKDVGRFISDAQELRDSERYNTTINDIEKLLNELNTSTEQLKTSLFCTQNLSKRDINLSTTLAETITKTTKEELIKFREIPTNHDKLLLLRKSIRTIKICKTSIEFFKEPEVLPNPKVDVILSELTIIYQNLKDTIANLEKLEKLKKDVKDNPAEVVTMHVQTSQGELEIYLPKENLSLSKVLQKEQSSIEAIGYNDEVIKEFFDFLATQFPPHITHENVMGLLHISSRFDVPSMFNLCTKFINENSTIDIILQLIQLGLDLSKRELFDCCEEIIDKNINDPRKVGESGSGKFKKAEVKPIHKIILELLFRGMETDQKEMIWFAARIVKKKMIFFECRRLIENTPANKPILDLLNDLSSSRPICRFRKELGQIELLQGEILEPHHFKVLKEWIPLTFSRAIFRF